MRAVSKYDRALAEFELLLAELKPHRPIVAVIDALELGVARLRSVVREPH